MKTLGVADYLLNGAIWSLAERVVVSNSLKDMVGPCGLEPQTSTVSTKFQRYAERYWISPTLFLFLPLVVIYESSLLRQRTNYIFD